MARALLFALMIGAAAPSAIALADSEHEVGEEAEEDADHQEHGGPVRIQHILHDTHFWAAVLNFTLLLIVLRKLGGKGISEFLKSRRSTMQASINEAAEIKAKAEAKHQEYTARLATLDAELIKLKTDLETAAVAEGKRITAEAEENAKRARVETESLIAQHAQALAAEVRREVVEAAVLAAQQVIAKSVNADDQQKLADGFRQRIETLASKSRGVAGGVDSAPRPTRAPIGGQS
jgi:F0F1-type ATP synthase membrane subunit b/b'